MHLRTISLHSTNQYRYQMIANYDRHNVILDAKHTIVDHESYSLFLLCEQLHGENRIKQSKYSETTFQTK